MLCAYFVLNSCVNSVNSVNSQKEGMQYDFRKTLISDSIQFSIKVNERLMNESKLFLDFWPNMTAKEYKFICEKLVRENRISRIRNSYSISMLFENVEQVSYDRIHRTLSFEIKPTVNASFLIEPNFINDSLKAISLQIIDQKNIGDLDGIKIGTTTYYLSGPTSVSPISEDCILKLYKSKYGNPSKLFVNVPRETGLVGNWKRYTWVLNDKAVEFYISNSSFSYTSNPVRSEYHKIKDVADIIVITYKSLSYYEWEINTQEANKKAIDNEIINTKDLI